MLRASIFSSEKRGSNSTNFIGLVAGTQWDDVLKHKGMPFAFSKAFSASPWGEPWQTAALGLTFLIKTRVQSKYCYWSAEDKAGLWGSVGASALAGTVGNSRPVHGGPTLPCGLGTRRGTNFLCGNSHLPILFKKHRMGLWACSSRGTILDKKLI